MMKFLAAALVFSVVGATGLASAAELIVDQKNAAAADTNPGTAEKPFKTITKALEAVKPGDTVLIKAGIYREEVEVKTSGTAEKRVTLKAAPGERAIVSGADEIKGWKKATKEEGRGNPNWEKLYVAEVAWKPAALFQDERMLKLSRFPVLIKTRSMIESGDTTKLVDAAHLTQSAGFWEGGHLTVHSSKSTGFASGTISGYDPEKHELTVSPARSFDLQIGKDEYFIKNLVSIIAEPGDWAYDAAKKRVYLWPVGDADPNAARVEGSCRGYRRLVRWAEGAGFITVDGLEIADSAGGGIGAPGTDAKRAHHLEILNCIIHHSGGHGVDLSHQSSAVVRHCLVARNGDCGFAVAFTKDCLIEECQIFGNAVDGEDFGWHSENCRFLRNCVTDQWSLSHPDGIQSFCDVRNFVIQDNLFLNIGQGFQCNNTYDVKILGNMFVGTRGGCLNLSPTKGVYSHGKDLFDPCRDFEIAGNTLACNAMYNISLLEGCHVYNNLGLDQGGYQQPGAKFQRDYNLYRGSGTPRPAGAKEGNDEHSQVGAAKFRNAPAAYYVTDDLKHLKECTPQKLYLRGGAAGLAVGDLIEINWDGRQRKVTEVGPNYIVFAPALKYVHPFGWDVVCNWKANSNFALDLRLADDSPGKKMGQDGQDVGANLDIQAYLKGDFNGDGKRDLPEAVKALDYEVHTADE